MSAATIVTVTEDLCGKKIYNRSFAGMNLAKKKLRQSLFFQCSFDDADLTDADCEGSEFVGSTFRRTICYRTNFKDAKLPCIFEPKDCFGMTLTMQCQTFSGMKISPLWWWGWIYFATLMHPITLPGQEDLRDSLIGMIGAERFVRLKAMFDKRNM